MERFNPSIETGLCKNEVEQRIKEGLVHSDTTPSTKSIKQIISGNFFTLFNFLNFGLALAILLSGSVKNLLFIGTVFLNMFISIFNEIRAKKIVDKLSLLTSSKVRVIRDSKIYEIDKEEVVLDDVVMYRCGDQILLDSIVLHGTCQVNESLISGEDAPVDKKKKDLLLSGSFITGGSVIAKVEHIKDDNYTSVISKDAKYIKEINSELMRSLKQIIKYISIAIVPVGILFFISQIKIPGNTINNATINTAAGLIGMIPDGLILLTSTVLAVSVIRLSKYKVLVQELYCIETLARVDVLCLDKTGTITEGVIEVKDVFLENNYSYDEVATVLDSICHSLDDESPTMKAIRNKFETKNGKPFNYVKINPFSSDKKYSSIKLKDREYFLGGYDFILEKHNPIYDVYAKDYRVLLLAVKVEDELKPMCAILMQDKIRESAYKTIEYFKKQGVTIKIISGDNPITVSQIAKRVGLDGYDKFVDLSKIDKNDLEKVYKENVIFGRVKPDEKKTLIMLIKRLGHTVAMTGDGVNDVLALKEADCSIAMNSGSDAARSVSQLVLMNSNFDSLPFVVLEGRRTINNIGRSASLFLTKTMYTILLVTTLLFASYNYPFYPIHLSLMNLITIGAPAFILALEKNDERIKGNFLKKVIERALPVSLTVYTGVIFLLFVGGKVGMHQDETGTIAVFLTTVIMLIYQFKLCIPFNLIRRLMFITLSLIFCVELLFFRDFFSLTSFTLQMLIITALLLVFMILIWRFYIKFLEYIKRCYKIYIREENNKSK